jgi:hypothetical protein
MLELQFGRPVCPFFSSQTSGLGASLGLFGVYGFYPLALKRGPRLLENVYFNDSLFRLHHHYIALCSFIHIVVAVLAIFLDSFSYLWIDVGEPIAYRVSSYPIMVVMGKYQSVVRVYIFPPSTLVTFPSSPSFQYVPCGAMPVTHCPL